MTRCFLVAPVRYGHVQLSAWTTNTEKAVITAAEILPSAPDAPEADGGGVAPKGYQQITGWQARAPARRTALPVRCYCPGNSFGKGAAWGALAFCVPCHILTMSIYHTV